MSNTVQGVHTTTNPKGTGWVNQSNGTILSSHQVKTVAVKAGRLLAKRHRTQLTVHRRDGTVVRTQSYSAAPIA
jgi:hypothetical protein